MGTSNQRVMQRAILMAAAALCVQAITNEADLAEMGEQVFMVGDPTDLPENPTKGADASFNMDDNDEDIGEHAEIRSPSDIEDEDSSHDVGASISVGRRGGMISTSGSFHMSSPGANRAGNDEEQFGEADEDEMNIGTGGRGGRGGRKRRRKSRKGWLKAQNVLRRRKARKKKSMGDKKRQKFVKKKKKFVQKFKKLCKKVQKKKKTSPTEVFDRNILLRLAKSGKSSKTGSERASFDQLDRMFKFLSFHQRNRLMTFKSGSRGNNFEGCGFAFPVFGITRDGDWRHMRRRSHEMRNFVSFFRDTPNLFRPGMTGCPFKDKHGMCNRSNSCWKDKKTVVKGYHWRTIAAPSASNPNIHVALRGLSKSWSVSVSVKKVTVCAVIADKNSKAATQCLARKRCHLLSIRSNTHRKSVDVSTIAQQQAQLKALKGGS